MIVMKKFAMGILALWVVEGCRKEYPENPRTLNWTFSAQKELLGSWRVKEFTIDGVDSTLNMPFSIDQIYKIYEDKGDYHLSARKEVVGSSGNMILSTLSGTIYASAKKEGGTLSTYLHSILSQNNIKTSLPPNGPLLNNDTLNQPNLPPWKILKLFKGELKCKTTFKGKNYYTFMKKL